VPPVNFTLNSPIYQVQQKIEKNPLKRNFLLDIYRAKLILLTRLISYLLNFAICSKLHLLL